MDPGPIFSTDIQPNHTLFTFCNIVLYFTANTFFPHHTINPLFSASRWDWHPHWIVGAKYLGCVVCRFHVVADAVNLYTAPLTKSASNTFRSDSLLLLDRLNLGFLPRENLLLCSSYLPLGVPNGSLLGEHQADFLAPLPGRRSTSARGVSHSQSFYLVIVFLILFLFAFLYRKYKKNSYSFHSCCFLCLLCSIKNPKKVSYSFYTVVLLLVHYDS